MTEFSGELFGVAENGWPLGISQAAQQRLYGYPSRITFDRGHDGYRAVPKRLRD